MMQLEALSLVPAKREIVFAFMNLSHLTRFQCAIDCDLVEPEDSLLEGQDLYIKWFQRAQHRNAISVFWDAIQAAKGA